MQKKKYEKVKSNRHAKLVSASRGRSMIEMLGVLAIIGVLSIGGLAGYKIAMNYLRANETIHDVMLRATNVPMKWEDYAIKTKDYVFGFNDMGAYKANNPVGYPVAVKAEGPNSASGYAFRVEVSGVPSEVCKRINNMNPQAVDKIETSVANCGKTTTNMTFYFDEDFKNFASGSGTSGGNDNNTEGGAGTGAEDGNLSGGSSSSSSSSSSSGGETCDESLKPTACHKCEGGRWINQCTGSCSYCNTESGECEVKTDTCKSPFVAKLDANGCYTDECICPDGTPSGADETTCACPEDKPVLDSSTNSCVSCVSDDDCNTENPCMHCVADETTGVKSCQQEGVLWRDNGTLKCCGDGYRSVLTVFSLEPTSEESSYEYALEDINGEKVFVGNSCCPSEDNSVPVVHSGWGDSCFSSGIPAANTDGDLSCCGEEQHVCGVNGIAVLGPNYKERICCDKDDGAYYDVNSETSLCCSGAQSGGLGPNYIDGVSGYDLAQHCCPVGSQAYWDGSSVQCCPGTPYKSGVDGSGNAIYECCATKQGANVVAYVSGAPINDLETCCDTATYGLSPTAYWDGNRAVCYKPDPCKHQCTDGENTWYCRRGSEKCGSTQGECIGVSFVDPVCEGGDQERSSLCEEVGYTWVEAILSSNSGGQCYSCRGDNYCACQNGEGWVWGVIASGTMDGKPRIEHGCLTGDKICRPTGGCDYIDWFSLTGAPDLFYVCTGVICDE